MSDDSSTRSDAVYLQLLVAPILRCRSYRPKFGQGRARGVTAEEFRALYAADPFYQWIGLDSPLMYAAHKAAGGMTSVYRQLGIGAQNLFRKILEDQLSLSSEQSIWSYEVPQLAGRRRHLTVDGRFDFADLQSSTMRSRLKKWTLRAAKSVLVSSTDARRLRGAVFEVRQGYKSKDSKRQNADIGNASSAYIAAYLPVLALLSTQMTLSH